MTEWQDQRHHRHTDTGKTRGDLLLPQASSENGSALVNRPMPKQCSQICFSVGWRRLAACVCSQRNGQKKACCQRHPDGGVGDRFEINQRHLDTQKLLPQIRPSRPSSAQLPAVGSRRANGDCRFILPPWSTYGVRLRFCGRGILGASHCRVSRICANLSAACHTSAKPIYSGAKPKRRMSGTAKIANHPGGDQRAHHRVTTIGVGE